MVSSAHYLAEIVLYAGLLAACGLTCMMVCVPCFRTHSSETGSKRTAALPLFAAVVANLHFAAGLTHLWYLQRFPVRARSIPVRCSTALTSLQDYPPSRSALWPKHGNRNVS